MEEPCYCKIILRNLLPENEQKKNIPNSNFTKKIEDTKRVKKYCAIKKIPKKNNYNIDSSNTYDINIISNIYNCFESRSKPVNSQRNKTKIGKATSYLSKSPPKKYEYQNQKYRYLNEFNSKLDNSNSDIRQFLNNSFIIKDNSIFKGQNNKISNLNNHSFVEKKIIEPNLHIRNFCRFIRF